MPLRNTLLVVLAMAACETTPPVGDGDPSRTACTRTDVRFEPRACVADEDCACGTHCSYQACTADCEVNADCGDGEVCDDLGRCSEPGGLIPPLTSSTAPALAAQPSVVEAIAADLPHVVRLYPPSGGSRSDTLRLEARGDARVWCPGATEPADACTLTGVDAAGVLVGVGLRDGGVDPGSRVEVLDVHARVLSIPVLVPPEVAPPTDTPTSDAMSGLYQGTARLGAGGGLWGPVDLPGAEGFAGAVLLPITATLVVDESVSGTLSLEDLSGSLLPQSRLTLAVEDGVVRWPALAWMTIEGTPVEIISQAVAVPLPAPQGGFALQIPQWLQGFGEPVTAGDLHLNLVKAGPLPANHVPSALTPHATPTLDPTRGWEPLAAGAAFDGIAALAEPELSVQQAVSGPWDSPQTCRADLDVPALRAAAVPAACTAAQSPNEQDRPSLCPTSTANFLASGATAGTRFECAYEIEAAAPRGCYSFDPAPATQRWQECLSGELAGNRVCTPDNPELDTGGDYILTGPTSSCVSGQCVDGVCAAAPSFDSIVTRCMANSCNGDSPAFEVTLLDRCEAARAATGCEIRNVPNAPKEPSTRLLTPLETANDGGVQLTFTLSERTVRECVVPAFSRDQACAVTGLCAVSPAVTASVALTAEADLQTGDVLCDRGVSLPAIPMPLRSFALPSDADVLACGADLMTLASVASSPGLSVEQITDDTTCFSPGRLVAAYDLATRSLRHGAPEPAGLGLAHRLLQGVAEVQAYVARDAVDILRQRITFEGNDDARPSLDQLDQSLAGWSFLLDPRVTTTLLAMPPEVLAWPDPRDALGVVPDPDASLGIQQGLPVSLLDALSEQLSVLDLTLERAWFSGSDTAIADRRARFADLMRTSALVVALAESLHARASLASVDPVPWEDDWQTARMTWVNGVRAFLARTEAIDADLNPLGIDEVDTPLFFVGSPESDRERFTAVARTLIGTGPGDNSALAPVAIREARAALAAARSDWRQNVQGGADSLRRQDEIIRRYGELITGYCGAPIDDPNFDVGTYNVLDRPLDTETCFVEPDCREAPDAFERTLGAADLGYQICVATRAGVSVSPVDDPELAAALSSLTGAFSADQVRDGAFPLRILDLQRQGNRRTATILVQGAELVLPVDDLGSIGIDVSPALLGGDAATTLRAIVQGCEAGRQRTLQLRPSASPTFCTLADDCRLGDVCEDNACVSGARPDILDEVDCYYDGAISEQALAVRSAGLEVESARAQLDEYVERYDIAMRGCSILADGAAAQEELLRKHNEVMLGMDIARAAAASVAHVLEGVVDCSTTLAGMDTAMPWSASISGGAAAVSCAGSASLAAANIVVETLETAMAGVERDHEAAVLAAANDTQRAECVNEASLEMVGVKAQSLRIRQAQQAQAAAVVNLRGQKSYTLGLWADGNAALAKERRIAKDAAIDRFVLSDAAELYLNRFRYAQRLTWLSVRAIEHELQRTETIARKAVIAAVNPDDLEEVLNGLSRTLNNGTIEGSQPTGLIAVLSLRDHLLQLDDRTDAPAGEQTLTATERFRLLLRSERYAVVDEDGRYLGQQIPFSLAPLGAYGLGANTAGIPVVAQSDCAERLWSVNAAVLGSDLGGGSSLTRIDLLQRNTFASQRCDDGAVDPLVTTTARPSVNLLNDLGTPGEQSPSPTATEEFVRGQMQPYLNVTRARLEEESFSQGATTQLAGRGLYGDYALFFPAAALSVDGGPGLRLEAVEDVLLRLDYVAAAR
jgi:hypothetical protein